MYQRIDTDAKATLDNGAVFTPVATLADQYGGRAQISIDDSCYVLCVRKDDKYVWSSHIFPEALEVLKSLPPPNKMLLDPSSDGWEHRPEINA